ncbi:uncharacterized protein LOC143998265 [Lithobates pipiens]
MDYVTKKIANLRTVFKKELNKIRASQKSGAGTDDIYVPRLWYYESLQFLTEEIDSRSSISTLPSSSATSPVPDCLSLEQDCENSGEELSTQENTESITTTVSPFQTPEPRGKKRKSSDGTSAFLAQATAALQRRPDDSDGFAIVVANKLKLMCTEQKQLAEKLLLEVLHKGVNVKLTHNTYLAEQQAVPPTPVPPMVSQPLLQQGPHWQYAPRDRPPSQWSNDYNYTQL